MCRALSCVANMFILIFGKMDKCSLSHDSETVPNMFILLETVSGRIRPNTTAFYWRIGPRHDPIFADESNEIILDYIKYIYFVKFLIFLFCCLYLILPMAQVGLLGTIAVAQE